MCALMAKDVSLEDISWIPLIFLPSVVILSTVLFLTHWCLIDIFYQTIESKDRIFSLRYGSELFDILSQKPILSTCIKSFILTKNQSIALYHSKLITTKYILSTFDIISNTAATKTNCYLNNTYLPSDVCSIIVEYITYDANTIVEDQLRSRLANIVIKLRQICLFLYGIGSFIQVACFLLFVYMIHDIYSMQKLKDDDEHDGDDSSTAVLSWMKIYTHCYLLNPTVLIVSLYFVFPSPGVYAHFLRNGNYWYSLGISTIMGERPEAVFKREYHATQLKFTHFAGGTVEFPYTYCAATPFGAVMHTNISLVQWVNKREMEMLDELWNNFYLPLKMKCKSNMRSLTGEQILQQLRNTWTNCINDSINIGTNCNGVNDNATGRSINVNVNGNTVASCEYQVTNSKHITTISDILFHYHNTRDQTAETIIDQIMEIIFSFQKTIGLNIMDGSNSLIKYYVEYSLTEPFSQLIHIATTWLRLCTCRHSSSSGCSTNTHDAKFIVIIFFMLPNIKSLLVFYPISLLFACLHLLSLSLFFYIERKQRIFIVHRYRSLFASLKGRVLINATTCWQVVSCCLVCAVMDVKYSNGSDWVQCLQQFFYQSNFVVMWFAVNGIMLVLLLAIVHCTTQTPKQT